MHDDGLRRVVGRLRVARGRRLRIVVVEPDEASLVAWCKFGYGDPNERDFGHAIKTLDMKFQWGLIVRINETQIRSVRFGAIKVKIPRVQPDQDLRAIDFCLYWNPITCGIQKDLLPVRPVRVPVCFGRCLLYTSDAADDL